LHFQTKAKRGYEFGTKVPIVSTQNEQFTVGERSNARNLCDGHTLRDIYQQTQTLNEVVAKVVVVDSRYCAGHETDANESIGSKLGCLFLNSNVMQSILSAVSNYRYGLKGFGSVVQDGLSLLYNTTLPRNGGKHFKKSIY